MIARDHATAHYAMGVVLTFTNRAAEGVAALERALALNRNLVAAHGMLGAAKTYLGRSEETEAHVHAALRLSPRDPSAFHWMVVAGGAAIPLGRDEEASRLAPPVDRGLCELSDCAFSSRPPLPAISVGWTKLGRRSNLG